MHEINKFRKLTSVEHIKMDVDDLDQSIEDGEPAFARMKTKNQISEETVEDLIAKLEMKGKKVVIHEEGQHVAGGE